MSYHHSDVDVRVNNVFSEVFHVRFARLSLFAISEVFLFREADVFGQATVYADVASQRFFDCCDDVGFSFERNVIHVNLLSVLIFFDLSFAIDSINLLARWKIRLPMDSSRFINSEARSSDEMIVGILER